MNERQQDIYSQRLRSYDTLELQHALACENLVRTYYGKVHHTFFRLKPSKGEVCKEEDINTLVDRLKRFKGIQLVKGSAGNYYFLGEKWVGALHARFQVDEGSGKDEVKAESGATSEPSSSSQSVSDLSLDLVYAVQAIPKKVEKCCTESNFIVLRGFEVEKGVPVTFAFPGAHGPEYHTQSFEGIKLRDVEPNYSVDVLRKTRVFLERALDVTSGILLVSGPVGTGKSYLIRTILTELIQRRAVVCTPPTQFLVQAGLLTQVVANFRKSIIVLEDIGEVIAVDAASRYSDARANLLNFSSGFLSLLTDTIVVISFNYEINKIDPAVLRPGRCLAHITTEELPYDHASRLVDFAIPRRPYSLAEIYEIRRVGNADTIIKRVEIGLR